jgi:hypothetical protein
MEKNKKTKEFKNFYENIVINFVVRHYFILEEVSDIVLYLNKEINNIKYYLIINGYI